jgi:hypothetical protein
VFSVSNTALNAGKYCLRPLEHEIAGSNPARGMNVCLRVSVLCCPVRR